MKTKTILGILSVSTLLLSSFSCSKSGITPFPSQLEQLDDQPWQLHILSGGIGGLYQVGEEEIGYKEEIRFYPSHTFQRFKNDEPVSESSFDLEETTDPNSINATYVLQLGDDAIPYFITTRGDSLLLEAKDCADCFNYVYLKK